MTEIPAHLLARARSAQQRALRASPSTHPIELLDRMVDMASQPPKPRERLSWQEYFLNIATAVSLRADCRRAQHGCVIVKGNRIVATGYNGSHPGGPSCLAGECPRGLMTPDELAHLSADYSNCIALHAEQNAVAYAARRDTEGAIVYITGEPCNMCIKLMRAAGIIRVIWSTGTLTLA